MKICFFKNLYKPLLLVIFLISLKNGFLKAEYFLEELQIDSSTKIEEDSSAIPTNPFEIVEMIRRMNGLNDATNPSDAIDDAIKSFNEMEKK